MTIPIAPRRLATAAVAAGVVAAAVPFVTAQGQEPTGDQPGAKATGTLVVRVRTLTSHADDVGRRGASTGDRLVDVDAVYDAARRRQIGRFHVMGALGDPRHRGFKVVGGFVFRDGTVETSATGYGRSVPRVGKLEGGIAIVGGTGAYAGARGWVEVVSDKSGRLELHFLD